MAIVLSFEPFSTDTSGVQTHFKDSMTVESTDSFNSQLSWLNLLRDPLGMSHQKTSCLVWGFWGAGLFLK